MSWNPNQLTNQIGQQAGQFASSHIAPSQGSGLLGQAQNKLVGHQIGSQITDQANQLLHIQPSSGAGIGQQATTQQSGGLMGQARNLIGNEANQFLHQGQQGIGGTQQSGGLMGQANQLLHQGQQGAGSAQQSGGLVGQVKNFAGNEANQFLHQGQQGASGAQQSGGLMGQANQLLHQGQQGIGTTGAQNQGGFVGGVKNFASNELNQALHQGSGSAGGHIPSGTSGTQRLVQGATQGIPHGTQQSGGGIGQQASNFVSKEVGGFFH